MEKNNLEKKQRPLSIYEVNHNFSNYTNLKNKIHNAHKNIFQRNFENKKEIKRKIMISLLKAMEQNYNMYLNNINSINFIYQIFGKGINMINHQEIINMNKTQNIMNCMEKHKFFTPINSNHNDILKYSKENNNKLIALNEPHRYFSPNNKFSQKFKIKYKHIISPIKRSNSCCIKNMKMNNKQNFALLPLKNILLKKNIENYRNPRFIKHNDRTSIIYKKKKVIEEEKQKEYQENLKLFSKKYEKEKEDFNNILFDEGIEFRKKKFKLESFIKRFTNKHFVEKLHRVKENALQKSQQ